MLLHVTHRGKLTDQGDIDAPSEPPCTRCKRESRECVFAPSKRGGNNTKRRLKDESTPPLSEMDGRRPMGSMSSVYEQNQGGYPGMGGMGRPDQPHHQQPHQQQNNYPQSRPSNPYPLPQYPPNSEPVRHTFSIQDLLQPSPGSHGQHSNNYFGIPTSSTQFSPADHSTPSQPSHTPLGSSIPMQPAPRATPSPKRRRLHLHPPVPAGDPSSIVVADMQNESDALHILALASQHGETKNGDDERGNKPQINSRPDRQDKGKGRVEDAADLGNFALIKLGIATKEQVIKLTDVFFRCHHHLLVSL